MKKEKLKNIENEESKNIDLIKKFFIVYFRVPHAKEFSMLGGNMELIKRKYQTYKDFIEKMGYPAPIRGQTYEVYVPTRNGDDVIFTGSTAEIAEEFDVSVNTVNQANRSNSWFKKDYKIRIKPFDPKLVYEAVLF